MADQAEKAAAYHSHRLESLVGLPGREGFEPLPKSQAGKTIAVFTSGGDSQGMYVSTLLLSPVHYVLLLVTPNCNLQCIPWLMYVCR